MRWVVECWRALLARRNKRARRPVGILALNELSGFFAAMEKESR